MSCWKAIPFVLLCSKHVLEKNLKSGDNPKGLIFCLCCRQEAWVGGPRNARKKKKLACLCCLDANDRARLRAHGIRETRGVSHTATLLRWDSGSSPRDLSPRAQRACLIWPHSRTGSDVHHSVFGSVFFLLCAVSLQILIWRVQTRPPWGWWGGLQGRVVEGESRRGGHHAESSPAFSAKLRNTRVGLAHCGGTAALQHGSLGSDSLIWLWECRRLKESVGSCIANNWNIVLSISFQLLGQLLTYQHIGGTALVYACKMNPI